MSSGNGIEATGLVKYDAMCRAIEAAVSIDEVKDIRDKAVALEKYMRLSRNVEAERRCAQLRILASAKGGRLAKKIVKDQGGSTKGTKRNGKGPVVSKSSEPIRRLKDIGLTADESSTWQQLDQSPEKVADYLANEPGVPSMAGALAAVNPTKRPKAKPEPPKHPFTDESLWVWGRVGDLDRAKIDPLTIAIGCDPPKRRDLVRHLDALIPILQTLRSHCYEQESIEEGRRQDRGTARAATVPPAD